VIQGRIEQIANYVQNHSPIEVLCSLAERSQSGLSFQIDSFRLEGPKYISLLGHDHTVNLFAEEIMEVSQQDPLSLHIRMDNGSQFYLRPAAK